MNLRKRISNSLSYGGIFEVLRKTFYWGLYKIAAHINIYIVKRNKNEFGLISQKREIPIIVSLTSFPKRFSSIGLCLKSITLQKLKPDRIIVYLGSDSNINQLTEEMIWYKQFGVEYRFDQNKNLMPHKKYYYAMQEFPEAIIVTADDDIIYPRNWLKQLYSSYLKFPNAISARRVHYISIKDKKLLSYDHWKDQCRDILCPSMRLLATGNGGVLYPPSCFDREAFNIEMIEKLCLRTDDLWLKCMEIRNKLPVVWVKNWQVNPATINNSGNSRLQDENIFTGKNDLILKQLMEAYSININDILL